MPERTILMISHVIPFPPAAGNEIRIFKMINWLRAKGYKVVLLLNADTMEAERRGLLEQVVDGVYLPKDVLTFGDAVGGKIKNVVSRFRVFSSRNCSGDIKRGLAPETLRVAARKLCFKYRPFAVIAEYIFAAPCLRFIPEGILKIIDTHDMFSRKQEQVISYGIDDPLECSRDEERRLLLLGDVIIAIQSHEAGLFKQLVPDRTVVTVGVDFAVTEIIDNSLVEEGLILFVGSGNSLNKHGLQEFMTNCWPGVIRICPWAKLRIVGKVGEDISRPDENISCSAWAENLEAEYRRAEIVINPVIAGSGLKIKTVEALCHAKPVVATMNAVEGLDYEGAPPFLVCRDWVDFALGVEALLLDRDKRLALQQRAKIYARGHFTSEHVYRQLEQVLDTHCAQ